MIRKLALIPIVGLLAACGRLTTPEPTAAPSPTLTPSPHPTPTPVPTSTPLPAPKAVPVEAEGFTLLVPAELTFDLQRNTVGIFDPAGWLIVSFTRSAYDEDANSLQDVIDAYLAELAARGGEFDQNDIVPVAIGGAEGIAVGVTGFLFDAPIKGRAVAVSPAKDSIFFGLGVVNLSTDKNLWENVGADIFEDLTGSIEFVEIQAGSACMVSADPTYGYTESNPIRVGGDFLDGPARERAYLNNLFGPNGELLSYERKGSFSSGDTILDEYRVTGPGVNVVLYLDEYKYEPPQAPVGFTCAGEFPLSAP